MAFGTVTEDEPHVILFEPERFAASAIIVFIHCAPRDARAGAGAERVSGNVTSVPRRFRGRTGTRFTTEAAKR